MPVIYDLSHCWFLHDLEPLEHFLVPQPGIVEANVVEDVGDLEVVGGVAKMLNVRVPACFVVAPVALRNL